MLEPEAPSRERPSPGSHVSLALAAYRTRKEHMSTSRTDACIPDNRGDLRKKSTCFKDGGATRVLAAIGCGSSRARAGASLPSSRKRSAAWRVCRSHRRPLLPLLPGCLIHPAPPPTAAARPAAAPLPGRTPRRDPAWLHPASRPLPGCLVHPAPRPRLVTPHAAAHLPGCLPHPAPRLGPTWPHPAW